MTEAENDYARAFNEGYKQAENDILPYLEYRLMVDAHYADGDYRDGLKAALRRVQAEMKRRDVESL